MLRHILYQTHFMEYTEGIAEQDDGSIKLSKMDEEIITDLTYLMDEQYYPPEELIYNKGDELQGILFVIEGEIHVNLRSSATQEYVLERLYKRCSYGFHQCLSMVI